MAIIFELKMTYAEARKFCLKLFIVFLLLTAVIAILSLLSGAFGKTELKVLGTTLAISTGSICAMSCAAFLEKGGIRGVGIAGILSSAGAVLMVIGGMWLEISTETYWQSTGTCIVIAIAVSHGCLLCMPKLADEHKWIRVVAVIVLLVLAKLIVSMIWGRHSGFDADIKLVGIFSVLAVLLTLVIPIVSRLDAKADSPDAGYSRDIPSMSPTTIAKPDELILRNVSGTVFTDRNGRRYQVVELDHEEGPGIHAEKE